MLQIFDRRKNVIGWVKTGPTVNPSDTLVGNIIGELIITDSELAKRALLDLYLRGLIVVGTEEVSMSIHNHGSEEGDGLSCPETRQDDGSLQGKCMEETG